VTTRPGPPVPARACAPAPQAVAFELGAWPVGSDAVRFRVWAPRCRRLDVHLVGPPARLLALEPEPDGHFAGTVEGAGPGTRYFYRLDEGRDRPDPVSRSQPDGVHGPSVVVDPAAFAWTDAGWPGVPLPDLRFYELHVGTFTPEGTFGAIVPDLDELRALGINAIELMPVAEFPGRRNWGYDGVHLFAPQSTYGGPDGLRRLVDAAHRVGLAVFLDVVYNHLGPEGNYLREYGPYFSDRHRTPWGEAVNYDGEGAPGVRRHVVGNACYWIREYHLDGLRLDAVHAIVDTTPAHILAEIGETVAAEARALGRAVHVVAESNRNDRRIVVPRDRGGYGLASQWSDDFHHSLRVTLTGARGGYYDDFPGGLDDLEVAFREGFVYQGRLSKFRERILGTPAGDLLGEAFVVFAQNHDQVGNQALGDRLMTQVSLPAVKVAAASVLIAPYLPLLFMGEEYGETAPFCFFTSFGDPALVEAVRVGRRREFARFAWTGEIPDPEDPATFARSRLDRTRRGRPPHAHIWAWYRALLRLRQSHPALRHPDRDRTRVGRVGRVLAVHRWAAEPAAAFGVLAYDADSSQVELPLPAGAWRLALDSEAPEFGGTAGSSAPATLSGGSAALALRPYQTLLYRREAGEA
jgi:maltooligosyltrehalose trehalohydrolase